MKRSIKERRIKAERKQLDKACRFNSNLGMPSVMTVALYFSLKRADHGPRHRKARRTRLSLVEELQRMSQESVRTI